VRSLSPSKILPLVLAALVAGCSSDAPPLPPDTTSVDRTQQVTLDDFTPAARAMTCDQIAAERATIAADMQRANDQIASDRSRNETAVGIVSLTGGLGLPALLATDSDTNAKDQITALYRRQDRLIELGELKHCPSSS
jgi:hypothetical protein